MNEKGTNFRDERVDGELIGIPMSSWKEKNFSWKKRVLEYWRSRGDTAFEEEVNGVCEGKMLGDFRIE